MNIKDFCSEFNKLSQDYSMCLSETSSRMYIMTEMGTVCTIDVEGIDFLTFIDEVKKIARRFDRDSLGGDIYQLLLNVKDEIRDIKLSKLDI